MFLSDGLVGDIVGDMIAAGLDLKCRTGLSDFAACSCVDFIATEAAVVY